jgi:uncharacterized protein YlxW (UPF0749 family)
VPVVSLVAGLGFAASATDSRGTQFRAPVDTNLADTVRAAEAQVRSADEQVQRLQAAVNQAARAAGQENSAVAQAQQAVTPLLGQSGLTQLAGPGLEVILDDAPSQPAGVVVDPNQLVVHQSDLQAVVNALWAGGAEAVSIAGQRVIATSAVRCVGNTLLLNGEVYSPPYRVAAIGPSATMLNRLASSPGVKLFREAAGYYGLGYTVDVQTTIAVPAYDGPITVNFAHTTRK